MLSYWERETFFRDIDVVVAGSGIVGLNAAIALKRCDPALRVVVVERGSLPSGASSKNAGFACFGSPSELLHDISVSGEQAVMELVRKRFRGLQRLRENLGDGRIGFEGHGGFEIFDREEPYARCHDQLERLNALLEPVTGLKQTYQDASAKISEFGFQGVKRMLVNVAEGQIDTGRMISALIDLARSLGVSILNGFAVDHFSDEDGAVLIRSGDITFRTRKMVIATNGFARKLLPSVAVEPARAQVLVTHPIPSLKLRGTFHYEGGYYYFRNIGNRILFGGGRNLDFENERTTEFGLTELVQSKLERMLKEIIVPYADAAIDLRWSGIMGVGPEKASIVQKLSDHVYCGVRMGGMGVAIGSLVGEEVAGLVMKDLQIS